MIPKVFTRGSYHYTKKSIAAKDAMIGWRLNPRPDNFSKGMECISLYLQEPINPENCRKLWSKHKIREDRAARGLTQTEYGKLFGVTEKCVASWEAGRREPASYFWYLLTFDTEALRACRNERIE